MRNNHEDELRIQTALEHGIALYRRYTEQQAAGFVEKHYRTVQRMRLGGEFDSLRSVRKAATGNTTYMGYEIVDIVLGKHEDPDYVSLPSPSNDDESEDQSGAA